MYGAITSINEDVPHHNNAFCFQRLNTRSRSNLESKKIGIINLERGRRMFKNNSILKRSLSRREGGKLPTAWPGKTERCESHDRICMTHLCEVDSIWNILAVEEVVT